MTFKHYILGSHYYIVSYLPWHIGFDDVTNKTGAGLTTFIIGFAKGYRRKFFSRNFNGFSTTIPIGDLIQIDNIKDEWK
jgi:hypothetical protein